MIPLVPLSIALLAAFLATPAMRPVSVTLSAEPRAMVIGDDRIALTVASDRAGHLAIVQIGTDGRATVLFPNALDAADRIEAGTVVLPRAGWRIRAAGPPGAGRLFAIVSARRVDAAELLARAAAGRLVTEDDLGVAVLDYHEVTDAGR